MGAVALLLVAGASGGIEACNPGEETAVKEAIEADAHSGVDVGAIDVQDVNGDSADATAFLEGHEFEVELVKEAGKWTVEKCSSEDTLEFPSSECPLASLGIAH
jgi:hypothetical protein